MARKAYADEKRESRLTLAVTPTLYQQISLLAYSQSQTTNDFIIRHLEKVAAKNSAVIEKFQTALEIAKSEYTDAD